MSKNLLHKAKQSVCLQSWNVWLLWMNTHHSYSIRSQQLLRAHGSDVGNVSKNVHKSHEGNGDEDSTGEVSVWKNIKTRKRERSVQSEVVHCIILANQLHTVYYFSVSLRQIPVASSEHCVKLYSDSFGSLYLCSFIYCRPFWLLILYVVVCWILQMYI